MLNVFRVDTKAWGRGDVGRGDGAPRPHLPTDHAFYFLDLPGYGYARASQTDRRKFGLLIKHALKRPRLAGVVWLLDIRREPSAEDMGIHEVFTAAGTPILAALTKGDTLSRARRLERARALADAVSLPADQVIVTSARTKDGIPELREAIAALVSALAA
jgi:GTP-binding protein